MADPTQPAGEPTFTAAQIGSMSQADFEKAYPEIVAALRDGRIVDATADPRTEGIFISPDKARILYELRPELIQALRDAAVIK
jgi:hypothetical protein